MAMMFASCELDDQLLAAEDRGIRLRELPREPFLDDRQYRLLEILGCTWWIRCSIDGKELKDSGPVTVDTDRRYNDPFKLWLLERSRIETETLSEGSKPN